LYNLQQQLAEAQVSLETIKDNEAAVRKYRADAEQLLNDMNEKFNEENTKMKKFSDAGIYFIFYFYFYSYFLF